MDRRGLDWQPWSLSSIDLTSSFLHSDDPGTGGRVALASRDGDGWAEMTYAELDRRSARVRTWLRANGVGVGDRVGLLGDSENDWVAAFLGVLRCGAAALPLDTRLTVDELAQIWARSTPAALIVSRRLGDSARAVFVRTELSPPVLLLDGIATCAEPSGADARLSMDEPAVVVWTSGTTGTAKGVCLTLANLDYVVTESTAAQRTGPDDRWLSILSLNHMLELACGLLPSLRSGATFCFARSLMPREVVESMRERGTTRMMVVPLVLRMLYDELARRPDVACRLEALFSGGAPLGAELVARYDELGIPVYEGYGLTELSPAVSMNSPTQHRPGSVGRPIAGTDVRIQEGEILVRSPGLMAGYWRDDALTATVIDEDGWFHTGDLGTVDPDGYLYLTGRAKDMIVLESGKKVHPAEVEAVLGASPLLAEVCVMAVRVESYDRRRGSEQVCAVVVPTAEVMARHRDGADLRAELVADVDRRAVALSGYKRPTVVEVWTQELPRTAKRTVRRAELARLMSERR